MATLVAGSLLALPATAPAETLQAVDGALSRPAAGDRADVALDWVRSNRSRLGLTADAVDDLEPASRTTSRATGFTHLRFRQADRGIPVFDGGVRVSLDRGGRIISAAGAPAPQVDSAVPRLDAVAAVRALGVTGPVRVTAGPAGVRRTTEFEGGDFARLVLYGSGRATRLAWHLTYGVSDVVHYDAVVDATTGAVLFRQNLVKNDVPADVFLSHPAQGAQVEVDFEPWLDLSQLRLKGPNAHVYSDVDDNDSASLSEEIERRPLPDDDFRFGFQDFAHASCPDPAEALCSWDSTAGTRLANREQNGVQAFYLVNRFHDHLASDPQIQFAGFEGVDAVQVETDDGAETGPNSAHVNNANMLTLPEGREPTMQLFLFRAPFRSVNGGDSAAIVWHEYTHGLSNRLVTYDDGSGALSSAQAGAMGEGWSDWYALDLLVGDGLMPDDPLVAGEVDVGHYVDLTPNTVRSMPIDCPVTPTSLDCPGPGYTYADFGQIAGGPEVHADGEIWAQTLWDLRAKVGPDDAQRLITEGMRLAPPESSFLDMRNAILAADTGLGGGDRTAIWQVFAARGMGYFAHADGGGDVSPQADFSVPPSGPSGRTTGTVTSLESGFPLGAVTVGLESLTGDAAFADRLATQTAANGGYALDAPAGTYGELSVERPGYDRATVPSFAVTAGGTRVQDVALRRDWAAVGGGATISGNDNTGADSGCGLARLNDQLLTSGWSATNDGLRRATVRLPATIDVTGFGLDPAETCGNPINAFTDEYRIDTSPDNSTWTIAAQGTFGPSSRGRLNFVAAGASNVRYVRLTPLSSFGTSSFIDFSELAVYGAPPNQLPSGSLAASRLQLTGGGTVDFAASFVDPDSRIVGYDWDFDGNGTIDSTTTGPTTSFTYSQPGTFAASVAVRDYRGGAGTASRAITVSQTSKPRITLPRRGRRGKLTARVTCVERCTVSASMRVNGRAVRTVRRTITTTSERRIELALTRKARRAYLRRHRRSIRARVTVAARYGDGRSTTARRTVRVTL